MVIVAWSPFAKPLLDSWLTRKNASIHLSLFSCSDSIMLCFCNFGFSIGGLATESPSKSQYATEKREFYKHLYMRAALRRFKNDLM